MKSFLRRLLQIPVALVIAGYFVLTAFVRPIIAPIVRSFSGLWIFTSLRQAIKSLGPYPSLILLIVPVIIIEPLKLGALVIIGSGRIFVGTIALLHGLSLLLIERLFAAVKPKLLTLRWIAIGWGWVEAIRDRLLEWVYATWAWSVMLRMRDVMRAAAGRLLLSLGFSGGP